MRDGDPFLEQFDIFDKNRDGVLSREEVVGRLCGEFGAERLDRAILPKFDDDGAER